MIRYPTKPILAAGISNPQDLQRVINYEVPIIHLESECQSLRKAQQRYLKERRYIHVIGFISSASLWGIFSAFYFTTNNKNHFTTFLPSPSSSFIVHYKKFIEKIPTSIIYGGSTTLFVSLTLFTAQFMRSLRYSYKMLTIDKETFLLRNDILYSSPWFILKRVIPYCLTASSVYMLCKHQFKLN
ncbi:unnamed protein product [Cunninghamella blakesleeana]